ncbi:MAG: glycosyltransferase [Lewinellaceae bacterium]|nr:glycosyltransferase [Lewinellaceae bacterium]
MNNLPISAVIVSCNDGYLLNTCLASLSFCEEIVVIDLESTDDTVEIASRYSTKIIRHPQVPIVEYIRKWVIDKVAFNWILFVDPDEVYNYPLQKAILSEFESIPTDAGAIELPVQFYFRGVPLKGGIWGGRQFKRVLRHRSRNQFHHYVHEDIDLLPGFTNQQISWEGAYIQHFWMQSFSQLLEKHRRYLKEEGSKMYEQGKHYSLFQHLYSTFNAFRHGFFIQKGYRDGFIGLFLSLFWCWYISGCWLSLLRYEQRKK